MVEEAFRLWNTTLSSLPEVPQPLLELLPHLGALLKRGKVRVPPVIDTREIVSVTRGEIVSVTRGGFIVQRWICESERSLSISNLSHHLFTSPFLQPLCLAG